jgi:hypothetical protein
MIGKDSLARIAADAAVQLDRAVNRLEVDYAAVVDLADALHAIVETGKIPASRSTTQHLWTTNAADLIDRALIAVGQNVGSHDELQSSIRTLVARLRAAKDQTNVAQLSELRDVCVSISRAAQSVDRSGVFQQHHIGMRRLSSWT